MIGIIGAMTVEVDSIKAIMTDKTDYSVSGMTFTLGKLCGKDTVVTVCGEGKVNAAMSAQTMILKFNPDLIVNTGVGGGLADGLKIGDVVAAEKVVQHDMDMSPLGHPIGYICGVDGVEMYCDSNITQTLLNCIKDCGINCRVGTVATGDQFISSDEKKNWLIENFGADVCEMEGGAIGQVCVRNNIPFGILRAISDGGDDSANMSFPEFAALAAKNSIAVMKLFAERF